MRAYGPGLAVLAAVLVANGAALWPEFGLARAQENDYVAHLAIAKRIVTAIERGENPMDCWSPESSLGFPQIRTYMILPHSAVAVAYFALGKSVSIENVFLVARWLAVFLLPLSFFACAAMLRLGPWVAAAAGLLAPLAATDRLYGLDYASFTSKGLGLFPQAVAASFLLLSIGCADRALRLRGSLVLAGVLLGCTFLSHFIYGYLGAVSVLLLALIRQARLNRVISIGAVSAALSAHQFVPLLEDGKFLNHSHWEEAFKWNSYGPGRVLAWLFTGQLLDFGRLPVLSLLAAAGIALSFWKLARTRRLAPRRTFLLCGAALWIALYCGRPLWGRAIVIFGIMRDFHVHRLIGGVQIFLVMLAATALAALWRAAWRRGPWGAVLAIAITAILLYPAVAERAHYLARNYQDAAETAARFDNLRPDLDQATALLKQRGGRIYLDDLSIEEPHPGIFLFLAARGLPIVPDVTQSAALTADLMVVFKIRAESFRQYNVRTHLVYGGHGHPTPFSQPLPPAGSLQLYDAPGTGYFDVVQAPVAVPTTRDDFMDINQRWLLSGWAPKNAHLWLDFGDAPRDLPILRPQADLPDAPPVDGTGSGKVLAEHQTGEVYEADYDAARPAFLLFRMTWHPNWSVRVDGREERTMMLSPGVIGVRTAPGRHHVVCRYQPGLEKIGLLLGGLLLVAFAAYLEYSLR